MKYVVLLLCVMVPGCGTMFENRIMCAPDLQSASFMSWYAGFGVGARIVSQDASVICARSAAPLPAAASAVK